MKELPHIWRRETEITSGAQAISRTLREAGFIAYWAGGCVRDDLLGRVPKDIDVATNASTDDIQRLFPKHVAVGKQFGVIVVPLDGINFEVAQFRSEGAYEDGRHPGFVKPSTPDIDATRRDFTINGLFWDPFRNRVIDYVDGLEDLKKETVRAIGDARARFQEDKLRVMRAVRFHTEFNFVLDPETSTAVREMAPQIHTISAERIRDELIKMMTGRSPRDALVSLSHHGLLKEVLPEVEAFKGVEQPPEYHPEGDVWVHVCLMLSMCSYAPLELVLGVLFHDVGKPPTFVRAPDRIRFHNHQRVGVEMTDEIMRRLKFPNKTIDTVKDLVGQHMRFGDTHLMRKGKLKNFVLQENFDLHLELHRIDCMGSHQKLGNYELCKTTQEEVARTPEILEPLVNGKDLIALGMKPGPEFKEILEKTREAQLEGIIKTKDDAIGYIKETWKTSG